MIATMFDTHRAVKRLQSAGLDEPLAEAVVTAIGEATDGRLATKEDLVAALRPYATKEDLAAALKPFATKEDLERYATKEDLAAALKPFATKEDLERYATKEDLAAALRPYATKEDLAAALKPFATREDLTQMNLDNEKRFGDLYRHFWFVGFGIVVLNVSLTVALIKLLP